MKLRLTVFININKKHVHLMETDNALSCKYILLLTEIYCIISSQSTVERIEKMSQDVKATLDMSWELLEQARQFIQDARVAYRVSHLSYPFCCFCCL